ncbi:MAG: FAD-dependent oxidoreductase [Raoultibacter sp.]
MGEKMNIDRRSFITGLGATGLLAAAGSMVGCAPKAPGTSDAKSKDAAAASWRDKPAAITDIAQTVDVDIVVVGAGNGGMVAACTAIEAGAKVVVIEKGGAPAAAREAIGAIGSKYQKDFPVDVAKFIQVADTSQSSNIDARLYRTWAEKSGEMMDWMSAILESKDVITALESAAPAPELSAHAYYPPICHNTFAEGYNPDGPNYGMYAHVLTLAEYFEEKGGKVYFTTPGKQLIQDEGGKVIGIVAESKEGNIQFNATKGVILCTGGYAANDEMLEELSPLNARYCVLSDATTEEGDGIKMALWAGGCLEPSGTCMIWNRGLMNDDTAFGAPYSGTMFLPGSQPFLHVNKLGERFSNEDKPYPMGFAAGVQQPGHFSWSVWDASYWEDMQQFQTTGCSRMVPAPSGTAANADVYDCEAFSKEHVDSFWFGPNLESGALKKCATLEELAAAMGLDAAATKTFLATVERYNAQVAQGKDEDFGKEAYRLSALDQPPYYAARMAGNLLVTINGIMTTTDSQAITEAGDPIDGLYVCGNDQGGFYPNNYPSQFIGLNCGRVSTFARIAAKHALGVVA